MYTQSQMKTTAMKIDKMGTHREARAADGELEALFDKDTLGDGLEVSSNSGNPVLILAAVDDDGEVDGVESVVVAVTASVDEDIEATSASVAKVAKLKLVDVAGACCSVRCLALACCSF